MMPLVIQWQGAHDGGVSKITAKIEAARRNKERPDYVWAIQGYTTTDGTFPPVNIVKYRIVGTLNDANRE